MSKKFTAVVLGLFVLTIAGFLFLLGWGSKIPSSLDIFSGGSSPPPVNTPGVASPTPKLPSITLTIEQSKDKNTLVVRWDNLPGNTGSLNIFRGKTGTNEDTWMLWKTISTGGLVSGNVNIDLGASTLAGYSFYAEAVTSGGGPVGSTSTIQTVLWTSSTTAPTVPGSPPPPTQDGTSTGSGTGTPSSTTTSSPSAPSSTTTIPPPTSTSTPTSTEQAPSGTPYYTPALQLSAYGQGQTGSFWVQHVDQKIEIGWQDLPPETTSITVSRSTDQNGPWAAMLTEQNPPITGTYSIQIVDNTLNQPYYYVLTAFDASSTIATYGPAYLPPLGQ